MNKDNLDFLQKKPEKLTQRYNFFQSKKQIKSEEKSRRVLEDLYKEFTGMTKTVILRIKGIIERLYSKEEYNKPLNEDISAHPFYPRLCEWAELTINELDMLCLRAVDRLKLSILEVIDEFDEGIQSIFQQDDEFKEFLERVGPKVFNEIEEIGEIEGKKMKNVEEMFEKSTQTDEAFFEEIKKTVSFNVSPRQFTRYSSLFKKECSAPNFMLNMGFLSKFQLSRYKAEKLGCKEKNY